MTRLEVIGWNSGYLIKSRIPKIPFHDPVEDVWLCLETFFLLVDRPPFTFTKGDLAFVWATGVCDFLVNVWDLPQLTYDRKKVILWILNKLQDILRDDFCFFFLKGGALEMRIWASVDEYELPVNLVLLTVRLSCCLDCYFLALSTHLPCH